MSTGHGIGNRIGRALVPLDESTEGAFIALQCQPNQITVCWSVRHSRDTEGSSCVEPVNSNNVLRYRATDAADGSAPPPTSPPLACWSFRRAHLYWRRRWLRAANRHPQSFFSQLLQRRSDNESLSLRLGLERGRATFICHPGLPETKQEKGRDRIASPGSTANSNNPLQTFMLHGGLRDRYRIRGPSVPERPRRLEPTIARAAATYTRLSGPFTSARLLISTRGQWTHSQRSGIRSGRYQAF